MSQFISKFLVFIILTVFTINQAYAGLSCCKKIMKKIEKVAKKTAKVIPILSAPIPVVAAAVVKPSVAPKPVQDAVNAAGHVVHNVVKEVGNTGEHVVSELGRAHESAGNFIEKSAKDVYAEAGRGVKNLEELGVAIAKYVERTGTDQVRAISNAERRIREGKVADALWHAAIDPIKDQENRAAKLAQESSLANTVGAVAASAYGGPSGAAAYSAWYAYRATGDIDIALKAGLISGATSAGLGAVGDMPIEQASLVPDMTKKAIMGGAIGGLAVAAAGGDKDAVLEGFIRSGGMILIQDGYKQFTGGHDLVDNTKAPEFDAFCSLSVAPVGPDTGCSAPPEEWFVKNEDGSFKTVNNEKVLDISKVDPRYSYVGKAIEAGDKVQFYSETSGAMNGIAKIPGMNAMAIFHDQWVIQAPLSGWQNQATIIPAIVLTYLGTEAGIQNKIQNTISQSQAHQSSPNKIDISADSYLCMKGNGVAGGSEGKPISHLIAVGKGKTPEELACVVVYQREEESLANYAPWYALNDSHYCDSKAEQFAKDHVEDGWTCLVR
jgi:hypothetical protein